MNWVWVTEHREWEPCNSRNCMEKEMDTTVMYITTSLENAVALIKDPTGTNGDKGWFVVYPEPVDTAALISDPQYQTDGRRILLFYDMKGNPLDQQPGKYDDDTTH